MISREKVLRPHSFRSVDLVTKKVAVQLVLKLNITSTLIGELPKLLEETACRGIGNKMKEAFQE